MPLDVVSLLRDLVRIPSVNPMGKPVSGPEYFEYAVTDYLQQLFTQQGWAWERQPVLPLRDNIIARLEGAVPPEHGGRLIVWEAHQDTVPVEGMTIPPWDPVVENGRVYGRGSCDIKGGLATIITALSRLAEQPVGDRPTIVVACTINEEHGYTGAKALAELWGSGRSKLLPRAPDAIIVSEPTSLEVVIAHKGVSRWRCRTHGRATHSSRPEAGENAIYAMAYVLQVLERYAKEVAPALPRHTLVGGPTLSVGTIGGGLSVNTVPADCVIEIDRRVLPGEDPLVAREAIIAYLQGHLPRTIQVTHEEPYIFSGGLSDSNNRELARQLSAAIQRCGGSGRMLGVPYGTNGSAYSPLGVPTVVFGPGSIDQAHTADEWVEIAQLEQAVEMLCAFAQ